MKKRNISNRPADVNFFRSEKRRAILQCNTAGLLRCVCSVMLTLSNVAVHRVPSL